MKNNNCVNNPTHGTPIMTGCAAPYYNYSARLVIFDYYRLSGYVHACMCICHTTAHYELRSRSGCKRAQVI